MNYLIIGNGIAGIEAAQTIRKNDDDGDITLITKSKYLHYYRPRLIDYLAGKVTLDQITIFKEDFYSKNRINNLLDTRILSIEPDENRITDINGKSYSYDKLLIAAGGISFIPPLEGVNEDGIFTLKGVSDSDRILDYCKNIQNVVVIGGGLLGLETANSLVSLGKNVSVIEFAPWLLPRQLDKDGGDILKRMLEKKDISFHTDEGVSTIIGDGKKIEKVILKSGVVIDADAVIISTGIRPKLDLAKNAGLEIDKGIVVNKYMQTSDENIYAAGDIMEHDGRVYGLWTAAKDQGHAAGLNMAGIQTEYRGSVISSQLKIAGIDLYSAGDISAENSENYIAINNGSYLKFLVRDGNPVGAIVLGDKDAIKLAKKVMERKSDIDELKNFITNIED